MNKLVPILTACTLLSACVAAPPPPPEVEYQPPPRPAAPPRVHHAHRKPSGSSPSDVATACPWPAHAKPSPARLVTASTQVPVPAGAAQESVEGCAVLRFGVSKAGAVSYVDVVSAKPDTVAPLAIKSLLAARFRPGARDGEGLVRVDLRSTEQDVVSASLKLR